MPESYGISPLVASPGNRQLFARDMDVNTRPILLTGGVAYTRGCVVFAATTAGPFVKATTGTLPTGDSVVALCANTIDLTATGNLPDVGLVEGEFIEETVLAACAVLDAPSIVIVRDILLTRGINLVHSAYSDITDAI